MMRLGKIAVCLAGGLALNSGLCAPKPAATPAPTLAARVASHPAPDTPSPDIAFSDNPYAAIAPRNIFGLNPPAPAVPAENPEDNLPKITPTGIMGVFGNYQVLFKVAAAKPAPNEKEQFYILSEGQRQDDIEVVKIDNARSLITFDNHGTSQELPLAEASASGGASVASAGGPNTPSPFSAPGPRGNGGPIGLTSFGANPGSSGSGAGTTWQNPNNQPGGPANGGLNFGGSVQGRIYQPEAPNLTPEAATILTEANKAAAEQRGDGTAPMYPPTALTEIINREKNNQNNGQQAP